MKWVKNWPIDDSIWDWPIHFHFLVGILVVWGVDLKLTHFTANWMLPKIGAWIWVEFLFEIGQFFSNFLVGLFGRFDYGWPIHLSLFWWFGLKLTNWSPISQRPWNSSNYFQFLASIFLQCYSEVDRFNFQFWSHFCWPICFSIFWWLRFKSINPFKC